MITASFVIHTFRSHCRRSSRRSGGRPGAARGPVIIIMFINILLSLLLLSLLLLLLYYYHCYYYHYYYYYYYTTTTIIIRASSERRIRASSERRMARAKMATDYMGIEALQTLQLFISRDVCANLSCALSWNSGGVGHSTPRELHGNRSLQTHQFNTVVHFARSLS